MGSEMNAFEIALLAPVPVCSVYVVYRSACLLASTAERFAEREWSRNRSAVVNLLIIRTQQVHTGPRLGAPKTNRVNKEIGTKTNEQLMDVRLETRTARPVVVDGRVLME